MDRGEWRQAPLGLRELPFAANTVAAAGLVPGNGDVDETLEEVLLGRISRAPGVLKRFVCLEIRAVTHELEPSLEFVFHESARAGALAPRRPPRGPRTSAARSRGRS